MKNIYLVALSLLLSTTAHAEKLSWECTNPPTHSAPNCYKAGSVALKKARCTMSTKAGHEDCKSRDTSEFSAIWTCTSEAINCMLKRYENCPPGYVEAKLKDSDLHKFSVTTVCVEDKNAPIPVPFGKTQKPPRSSGAH